MKIILSILLLAGLTNVSAKEISITMDDPEITESVRLTSAQRNQQILEALEQHAVKAALFVCGMRIDSSQGKELLKQWDVKGHLIGNHSYSHLYFPGSKNTLSVFQDDFKKVEPLVSGLKNFTRLFRFPYLKEGDTKEKRNGMREFLKANQYKIGYVSIDASDWYIDERLRTRLEQDSKADIAGYRDYYLKHILDRAEFYNDLALKSFNKDIKHTLLIHHNLLNALFLNDLLTELKKKDWKIISAKEAFTDSVYQTEPDMLPAGESIVWATAKMQGKYPDLLRYPAEDGRYEKEKMDKLGL